MKPKIGIVLSVLITVMVLTVIGGVAAVATRKVPAAPEATQTAVMDPTREAEYQALIAQANETIDQANQQIAVLSAIQAAPTTAAYSILPDQAVAIASNVSGESALRTPELVNYSGQAAYAVNFPDGLVYVDASTGEVLYNGVMAAQIISKDQATQIAINYTGDTRVVEVISGTYNGAAAYSVMFSNGEKVYMDLYGNILAVQLPVYNNTGGGGGGGDDDDDDDHDD